MDKKKLEKFIADFNEALKDLRETDTLRVTVKKKGGSSYTLDLEENDIIIKAIFTTRETIIIEP